jgi:putative phage-type endonuclease
MSENTICLCGNEKAWDESACQECIKWKKDRVNYIGASEVPAVLGIDSFCTPLKLWGIKTGLVEQDDLADNEAVEWGMRLERLVSKKFAEKHNVKLIAYKKRYISDEHPFISCELDNIISGTDELVEIKTVNAWAWKSWEKPDELPEKVIAQVMTQLGLSDRKVGWVACLCGGQKYIEKRIEFDQEFYNSIIEKVVVFWEMVQNKTPPMATVGDDEILLELNPRTSEDIPLVDSMNDAMRYYKQLGAEINEKMKKKDGIKAQIMQAIGKNLGIKTQEYVAKLIDIKATEYVVKKEATRQLRIDKIKERK